MTAHNTNRAASDTHFGTPTDDFVGLAARAEKDPTPHGGGDAALTVLSLFSGIGGLELGLERAGMVTLGQVEIDDYCRSVLADHWPAVPRHDDVRTAVDWWTSERRPAVDVVCGGFPCQPFSQAGLRLGAADERWLWPSMLDVIRHVRPRYVLVENVATLADDADAFGTVLRDLSILGFDAEWSTLLACAVGAAHARERLFLVAYNPRRDEPGQGARPAETSGWREPRGSRLPDLWRTGWLPEPEVDRVAYGLPIWMVQDALHALGNAVVPQVAEYVGRLIVAADRELAAV